MMKIAVATTGIQAYSMIHGKRDEDCEAIICGQIKRTAFDILYKEGISRYDGSGKNATQALKALGRYELNMITDCIGGTGCVGAASGGECHEH